MTNSNFDPTAAQRTATLISLSLAMSVTLFAAVTWFMHSQGMLTPSQNDPAFIRLLTYIWIGFMAMSSIAALVMWRSKVEPLISENGSRPRAEMTQLQTFHLLCLALVEAPSLLGVVVYFLSGEIWPAILSVAFIWFVVLATRPQLEWFQRFR